MTRGRVHRCLLLGVLLSACGTSPSERRSEQETRCQSCEPSGDTDPTGGGTYISPTSPIAAPAVAATVAEFGDVGRGFQVSAYINGGTGPLAGPRGVTGCIHADDWSTGLCCTLWEGGQFDCIAF